MRHLLGTCAAAAVLFAGAAAITPAMADDLLTSPYGYGYGGGYGYGYGGANPTIVGLAFWSGKPYTYWACQLGVDFQCPSSPNYAYRRPATAPAQAADDTAPIVHRRKHRVRQQAAR